MALVGRIARTHGLRGEVVVNPETDFPEARFRPGAELFVERHGTVEPVTLTTVRFHKGRPIVGLAGVDTISAAEELGGVELRIPVDRLVALPDAMFYRHELVGCRVEMAGGRTVGVVREVEGDLARSRLVVDAVQGEILIPLTSGICTVIDLAARRIVIDPPDGLLELNARSG